MTDDASGGDGVDDLKDDAVETGGGRRGRKGAHLKDEAPLLDSAGDGSGLGPETAGGADPP